MRNLKRKPKGRYVLAEEGKRYLAEGLPEENLVKLMGKETTLSSARKKTENFNIALSWAKKNGWVRIEKGKLVLAKKPEGSPVSDALRKVSEGGKPDERMLSVLLQRKLVDIEKESTLKRAKRLAGKEVTVLTAELIKTGMWKKAKLRPYNVTAGGDRIYPGKRQPYNRFLAGVRRKLVELGFREMTGPIIELEFWNFDALFQAQNHPSRDWAQTYSLKSPKEGTLPDKKIVDNVKAAHESGWTTESTGWGYKWDPKKAAQLMPRAHDTAISPRFLSGYSGKIDVPGKYFSLVRCFRPDVIDATHGVEFNQLGGFIIGEGISVKHLFGILKQTVQEITGLENVRFRPDYFPFTEMSVEVSVKHDEMGWMELAGAGIFREEVTKPLGINLPVIAWGFGIDRLAMLKLDIKDIRNLFSQDIDWLRKQKVTV